MATSDVSRLNYCTHAIEDLRELVLRLPPALRASRQRLERVCELLDAAVKFILPERGDMVDLERMDETLMQTMLRLPFPLVVLEIPFPPASGDLVREGPMKETLSSRRIVLAWDDSFADQSQLSTDFGEPGVYVMSIYFDDTERRWAVAPCGAFTPLANLVTCLADANNLDPLVARTLLHKQAVTAKTHVLQAIYFEAFPQFAQLLASDIGQEAATARMQLDVRDEVMCTHSFCLTVNCVNVTVGALASETKLNAKRIRNGKPPLYDYKVLELPEPRSREASGLQLEGLRLSPRMHLRRGHPRRLGDGRLTYVRAAMVGSNQAGVVDKEYRVLPRAAA